MASLFHFVLLALGLRRRLRPAWTWKGPAATWRQRWFWCDLGVSFVRGWLFLCVLLWALQRSFLYRPEQYTAQQYAAYIPHVQTALGLPRPVRHIAGFDALVLEPPEGAARGTAVLFHGNAGSNLHRHVLAPAFLERGWRLVLAEYPGYGARPGPISEPALVEDAYRLVQALRQERPDDTLLLVGESLGSGVAVQVALQLQREDPAASTALAMLTPFDSLRETAARTVWFAPVRWLIEDEFDSAAVLGNYRGAVRLLLAEQDEVVGLEAGMHLARVAQRRMGSSSTEVLRLAQTGHNSWRQAVRPQHWDQLLAPVFLSTGPR